MKQARDYRKYNVRLTSADWQRGSGRVIITVLDLKTYGCRRYCQSNYCLCKQNNLYTVLCKCDNRLISTTLMKMAMHDCRRMSYMYDDWLIDCGCLDCQVAHIVFDGAPRVLWATIYLLPELRVEQYWYRSMVKSPRVVTATVFSSSVGSFTSTLNVRVEGTSTLRGVRATSPLMLRSREINLSFCPSATGIEPGPLACVASVLTTTPRAHLIPLMINFNEDGVLLSKFPIDGVHCNK